MGIGDADGTIGQAGTDYPERPRTVERIDPPLFQTRPWTLRLGGDVVMVLSK